jgi:hypothetical protein
VGLVGEILAPREKKFLGGQGFGKTPAYSRTQQSLPALQMSPPLNFPIGSDGNNGPLCCLLKCIVGNGAGAQRLQVPVRPLDLQ